MLDLGASVPDDDTLKFLFMQGLKPHVRTYVLIARPKSLDEAMLTAERTDSAIYTGNKSTGYKSANFSGNSGSNATPMELGNTQRSQNGNTHYAQHRTDYNASGVTCYHCGKKGHLRRNCRQL